MFGFESLGVYEKAREFNYKIRMLIKSLNLDFSTENQLRRASLSVVLNISEGTSRFSKKDVRRFYIITRGSLHECVSILDVLQYEQSFNRKSYDLLYQEAEILSRTIFKLIKNLSDD